MSEDLYGGGDLLLELENVVISLLNLLIQVYVVDLELFKVYHVQALGKLLLHVAQDESTGRATSSDNLYLLPEGLAKLAHLGCQLDIVQSDLK